MLTNISKYYWVLPGSQFPCGKRLVDITGDVNAKIIT